MYRIIDGRGTGKTSRLMLLAKENNGIIVCSNPIKMAEKAEVYGIIGLTFVSYKQFMETPIDPFVNYYIDELEEDMFELFDVRGKKCFLPEEENLGKNDFVILPNPSDNQNSITDIVYVDDPTAYRSEIAGKLGGKSFVNFKKLGLYIGDEYSVYKTIPILLLY